MKGIERAALISLSVILAGGLFYFYMLSEYNAQGHRACFLDQASDFSYLSTLLNDQNYEQVEHVVRQNIDGNRRNFGVDSFASRSIGDERLNDFIQTEEVQMGYSHYKDVVCEARSNRLHVCR